MRQLAIFFLLLLAPVLAQGQTNTIAIRVNDAGLSASAAAHEMYLNGYDSAVNGQTIEYHSSDPDVDSALLVRGQHIAQSISWKSAPLPEQASGYVKFVWLAGIECKGFDQEKETHSFDFRINGEHWFTFINAKDETSAKWKVAGKDGAELSFAATMSDKAGDLFGTMALKIPVKDFDPGKPLLLEVDGDNSGSADWYMTFQHRFNFIPQVREDPALLRSGAQISQVLRLSLDNLIEGRTLEVNVGQQAPTRAPLKIGANILRLPIPAADSDLTWHVRFEVNGKPEGDSTVLIKPVKRREIYLLSYSHNDIGYTELQRNVERKQWNNLEEGMRLVRETRDYPADARYKWNLETIWALESYLKQASRERQDEFWSDVREGSIGLSALYANMLTGLANSVEMGHFYDFARSLRSERNISMNTAVTSDVPGFSWGIVTAMAQNGVKYFATGPNAEDRIGYTLQTWGDKPFYWVSQSGQEKVLTWMAGASYSSFHEGSLSKMGDDKIMKLMRKLDDESYPYDMVQLPYTLADNGPPDPTLSDFVRSWNERYASPRLVISTHEQMFKEFEKRYGPSLPVVRGDFTPYWEDGAASTAAETAMNRAAADRLIQGQAVWSMLAPSSYPSQEYESAWRNVSFYDEHTWGAHNSIEEPDLPFVKSQWEFKRDFAVNADRASRALLMKALASPTQTPNKSTAIDIYNTNSWPRTDVVFLSPELSGAGDRVVDSDGKPMPCQRLSSGELAVLVEDLAPFSARRVRVEPGAAHGKSGLRFEGNTLENEFLVLSVNSDTGDIVSLKTKRDGVELVDRAHGGLNQYLYVRGADPAKAQPISHVRVRVKESGNLVVSLLVEGDAPGENAYSTEIRLLRGIGRVDVIDKIDKRAVREKEGVHIAFPFAMPGAQVRYDVANSIVRPEKDQLPGACKNFFSVQNWADVSNSDYGVTLASINAPLIEIGRITAEQPWLKDIQSSPLIYSYVMNNYWHTNYKADQEGPLVFSYSLLPHAAFRSVDAVKFGIERRQPLLVAVADSERPPANSLMSLASADLVVNSLSPAGKGEWLAYVYNPTDVQQSLALREQRGSSMTIWVSDPNGLKGERVKQVEIPAFGSAYVLLSKK